MRAMRCPSCGAKVKRSQARCPSCGSPLVPMPPMFGGAAREVRPELGYPAQPAMAAVQPETPPRVGGRVLIVVVIALALVAFSLVALLVVRSMEAPGRGVPITPSTFPDAALRAVVKTYDADDDDALNADEVASITSLDCSARSIGSLRGISTLTALTTLDASRNNLTDADLSSNAALTSANLSDNRLTSVTLANLGNLGSLDVSDNALTALDLSACGQLRSLACTGNGLARLDLSKNGLVTSVSADPGLSLIIPIAEGFFPDAGLRASLAVLDSDGDGALSDRERSSAASLQVSDASTADLTGLAWLPSLTTLDISGCAVTSVSGSQLPAMLNSLVAKDSQLSTLDLEGLEWLYVLDITNTAVSSLDLSATPHLTNLSATASHLSSLDVTPCAATLSTLHIGENVSVTGALTRTAGALPDPALRGVVFSSTNNPDGDDMLTGSEVSALTSLDLSGTGTTNLAGLPALTSLRTLVCNGLQLGSFSAQGLTQLQSLSLSGCGLTSVDVSAAGGLASLDVSNNDLDALVVSTAPGLTQLNATGNARLTAVDATGCLQLVPGESALVDEGCTIIQ